VASNVSLKERVKQGLFREDLYYRINVVYLRLPELKERPEDIPALCRVFLRQFSAETGREITGLSPSALRKLTEYPWPGNVRELRNVIHRAMLFCQEGTLSADHIVLPERPETPRPPGGRSPYYLSLTKKEHVEEALRKNAGHATRTARELGIARITLYKFLRRHGINPKDFRRGLGGR
jgi:DNA-binding NtrC family response regulator